MYYSYWMAIGVGLVVMTPASLPAQVNPKAKEHLAHHGVRPMVKELAGTIIALERTLGNSKQGPGLHIIVQTPKGKRLDIDLGPEQTIQQLAPTLKQGQSITLVAFQYFEMHDNQYIGKSLMIDDQQIELRDDDGVAIWEKKGKK